MVQQCAIYQTVAIHVLLQCIAVIVMHCHVVRHSFIFSMHCVWKSCLFPPEASDQMLQEISCNNAFLHKSLYHRLRCRDALPYMLNTSASTSNKPLSQEWWSLYIKLKETCFPSQEPSWVCSSLQTATSSGRIYECVSCSASYIHHSWGKLQAGVLQPSLCMVLVSSRGSSTPTSSCIEINML